MIPEDKVRAIHSTEQLLSFMHDELDWQLPPQPILEEVTFDWTGAELNLSEDAVRRLRGGVVRQLRPFKEGQPWGVFLVEFADSHVYRTALRQILRRLVPSRRSSRPDLPSWHWENLLFICTTKNQEFTFAHFRGEKPERARLITFSWEPEEPIRTLCEFNLPPLHHELDWDNETWLKEWHTAFDVEKVTEEFFRGYKQVFKQLQDILYSEISHQSDDDKKAKIWAHDYSLQFLNRLMFLYFIQKKRWLGDNPRFIRYFWDAYRRSGQAEDTFFENWLKVLFFEAFNNRYQSRAEYLSRFGEEINEALSKAPFLNGGLFSPKELDRCYSFDIPDEFFGILFEHFDGTSPGFFERYNFTISETTPLDQEVAVDPEMTGKVYESLVNITFEGISEEDLRGSAGIFYTPRVEIDLMCRLSLVDYLTNHLEDSYKPLLYQAVFAYDPKEKEEADKVLADENLWGKLDDLLRDIAVVDPACGSGSFLVGMLLVLDDLLARADSQLGKKETPFERRKEIIANSLYGVDVMPWAVHVAELRLWLQLVVETELEWWEMKAAAMLPNLSFKLRPGDSLVQEVGGINFGLHRAHQDIPAPLKGKLTQLKGEKLKFYRNDPQAQFKTEAALKQEELKIFRETTDYRVQKLEEDIKTLTRRIETPQAQAVMPGMGPKAVQAPLAVQQWKDERSKLEEELKEVRAAREALRTTHDIPFVWDIAFVEIFRGEKEGFDIVIGNPPYVLYKRINDPQRIYDETVYKTKLRNSVYAAYPKFFGYDPSRNVLARRIDARSDYYIYFYLHGLKLLNEIGSFCFITSNSWLDVDFGKDLQELLLKHCHVKMILDNEKKRSFAQVDVNTIITLFSAVIEEAEAGLDKKARFIMFKVPFEQILTPVVFDEIEETAGRIIRPEFRCVTLPQSELLMEGLDISEGELLTGARYGGNKWGGKHLRAPDIFWTILDKGKDMLEPLSKVADMATGVKESGYSKYIMSKQKVSPSHLSGACPEILKDTAQHKRIVIDSVDSVIVGGSEAVIRKCSMLKYPILWLSGRGHTHKCHINPKLYPFSGNYLGIKPMNMEEIELLCTLLNSTFVILTSEIMGRSKGIGGAACVFTKTDLMKIPILKISRLQSQARRRILEPGRKMQTREFKPMFQELGLTTVDSDYSNVNSQDVSLDKVLPDRRALDKVVFEALGLTEAEQLEVYRAVIELVKNRLVKAESV